MGNAKSIQILRGTTSGLANHPEEILLDGQPLLDKTNKWLYLGDGVSSLSQLQSAKGSLSIDYSKDCLNTSDIEQLWGSAGGNSDAGSSSCGCDAAELAKLSRIETGDGYIKFYSNDDYSDSCAKFFTPGSIKIMNWTAGMGAEFTPSQIIQHYKGTYIYELPAYKGMKSGGTLATTSYVDSFWEMTDTWTTPIILTHDGISYKGDAVFNKYTMLSDAAKHKIECDVHIYTGQTVGGSAITIIGATIGRQWISGYFPLGRILDRSKIGSAFNRCVCNEYQWIMDSDLATNDTGWFNGAGFVVPTMTVSKSGNDIYPYIRGMAIAMDKSVTGNLEIKGQHFKCTFYNFYS